MGRNLIDAVSSRFLPSLLMLWDHSGATFLSGPHFPHKSNDDGLRSCSPKDSFYQDNIQIPKNHPTPSVLEFFVCKKKKQTLAKWRCFRCGRLTESKENRKTQVSERPGPRTPLGSRRLGLVQAAFSREASSCFLPASLLTNQNLGEAQTWLVLQYVLEQFYQDHVQENCLVP